MAFCKVCGNTLDENGKCICGADQTADDKQANGQPSTQMPEQQNWSQSGQQYQPQPNQQYQPQPNQQYRPQPNQQYQSQPNQQYQPQSNQYQPQPGQQAYQQPVQKSQFGVELSKVLKSFFSISPTDSLTHATKSSSPLFALLGGLYCLFYGFSSIPTSYSYYTSSLYGYDASTYVTYFFNGLILGAIVFFAYAGLIKLIHIICKQDVNFIKIMNMVSVALIPASISLFAGAIISFVLPSVGSWITSAGTLMGTLMIYIGMQKEAKFKHSPIWLFTALYLVLTIVKYAYTYITTFYGF